VLEKRNGVALLEARQVGRPAHAAHPSAPGRPEDESMGEEDFAARLREACK
jgi:hypothetical protein